MSDEGAGLRYCRDIAGYLTDERPGGRTVHARPDARARVIGRILEPLEIEPGFRRPVIFDILASRDGWLKISGAGDLSAGTEGLEREMYEGEGWIRGDGVSVTVQATRAFAAPRHSSPVVLQSISRTYLDGQEVDGVSACDGTWGVARWRIAAPADFSYRPEAVVSSDPLILRGWATGICNNPDTSCDMQSGDYPATD